MGSTSVVVTAGGQFIVPINAFTIPAGQTYGIYFTAGRGVRTAYTNGSNTYSNNDLTVNTGKGVFYPFGSTFDPRTWNGTIYYSVHNGSLSPVQIAGLPTGSIFPLGVTTNTFVVTDPSGNADTCSFTVTVNDSIPPAVLCQAASIYLDASRLATLTIADVDGGTIDNCSTPILSVDSTDFDCSELGVNTVTLSAVDSVSNSSNNCSTPILSVDSTDFDCSELGVNTVTLSAVDSVSNSSSCAATVTVIDTIAPDPGCQPVSIYLDNMGSASVTASLVENGSSDNCAVDSMYLSKTAFDCTDLMANMVVLTVLDLSGNSDTCQTTITVLDTIAPTVAFCPAPIVACEDDTVHYTTPSFDDNCDGSGLAGTLQTGLPSGSVFPVGTNYARWTYTDLTGNVSPACSVEIVVSPKPRATDGLTTICDDAIVGFDLQAHIDVNGNGLNSNFIWQGNPVAGVVGATSIPTKGDTITDRLINITTTPRTVVYTVSPMSDPEGCTGPSFTITVVINPSSNINILPIHSCPGDLVDLAGAVRDYSLLARVVVFYDAHPDSGGNVIGQAPMFRGAVRSTTTILVSPLVSTTYYVSGITPQGCVETLPISVVVNDSSQCLGTISPIALLEGARNAASGTQRTALQQQAMLPVMEPYTALGYTFTGGGGEIMNMASQLQKQVVDWVILELHDPADSSRVTYSRAALLMADGRIVDTDGLSPPSVIANPAKSYYLVVRHRNHLGLMTAQPVPIGSTIDFTDPNTAIFGTSSTRTLINGKAYLVAGDANGDGQIQNTDDVLEWIPSVGTSGYQGADYNLDGQVQNTDRVFMWMRNVGRGTAVPD
jgi:hypothetical protein